VKEVHVIPVPRHMTTMDAWYEISVFGQLHGYRWWKPRFWVPRWAVIEIDWGTQ
jgi:hypothetical protein